MDNKLGKKVTNTRQSFKESPSKGLMVFSSSSSQVHGFRSEVQIRNHQLTVDEPVELGGTNAGPNPIELILAALGTCQEITYRTFASVLGIPLESVSVKLDGHINLCGFFAVDDAVRPGYQKIIGTVTIKSTASKEELQKLREMVEKHCPVTDIISNPVPLAMALEIEKVED